MRWAVIFALIAATAALFGYTGFSRGIATVGRFVFGIFLALSVLFAALTVIGMWEMNW